LSQKKLSDADFLWVCDTLYHRLSGGMSLVDAFSYMQGVGKARLYPILDQIKQSLLQGQSFITTLFRYAPPSVPYRLTVTELDDPKRLLHWLATYYRNKQKNRDELIRVLRYPIVLLCAMVSVGGLIITVVLPQQQQLLAQLDYSNSPLFGEYLWTVWVGVGVIGGLCLYGYYFFKHCSHLLVVGRLLMSLGGLLTLGISWKNAIMSIDSQGKRIPCFGQFKSSFFKDPRFSYYFTTYFNVSMPLKMALTHIETLRQPGDGLYELGDECLTRRHLRILAGIRIIQPLILISITGFILWAARVLFLPMMTMVNTLHF
jgi:type II secretory pathway component PulF